MAAWDVNASVTTDEQLLKQIHKEIFLDHRQEAKRLIETNWAKINPVGRISMESGYTCRISLKQYSTSPLNTNEMNCFPTSSEK